MADNLEPEYGDGKDLAEVELEEANVELESSENKSPETSQNDAQDFQTECQSTELQVDLSDPDSLIKMLESVDISEEDTDQLLQEAYKMNRKLKELLRMQEHGGSAEVSQSDILKAHNDLFRSHTTLNKSAVLPPIGASRLPSGIYDIKRTRSSLSRKAISTTSASHSAGHKKSSNNPTGRKSSSRASHKTSREKPEWDDRFSYS